MKKISYVLVSRNDNYCGDSVGRLTTTLNHTGDILFKKGKLDQSEVVLIDWNSPNAPLSEVLSLNENIKQILKIVTIPPQIANKYQKDSPFSEVHAMNCGFRRMSGEYFARIDQDTLIGERFIDFFYDEFEVKDYGFDWPKVLFSGRRNLSPEQSKNPSDFIEGENSFSVEICHPHNYYSRIIPNKKAFSFPFYGGAVGILIVHKDIFLKEKGFNEEMIYMNNMDTELFNRLAQKYPIYNLGLKVEADFYHIFHERRDGAEGDATQPFVSELGNRKTNDLDYRRKLIDNCNVENYWGLKEEII